jgi:hypothetical protein
LGKRLIMTDVFFGTWKFSSMYSATIRAKEGIGHVCEF